jgi:hypothetical protein
MADKGEMEHNGGSSPVKQWGPADFGLSKQKPAAKTSLWSSLVQKSSAAFSYLSGSNKAKPTSSSSKAPEKKTSSSTQRSLKPQTQASTSSQPKPPVNSKATGKEGSSWKTIANKVFSSKNKKVARRFAS